MASNWLYWYSCNSFTIVYSSARDSSCQCIIARWKALQKQHDQNVAVSTAPLQSNSTGGFDWRLWTGKTTIVPILYAPGGKNMPSNGLILPRQLETYCLALLQVDVERLFSGCKDEYGIRRHSLKSETVRVLTLLRSAYESEDTVNTALIKAATELDIQAPKNSILWRPDNVSGQLTEGKLVLDLYAIY